MAHSSNSFRMVSDRQLRHEMVPLELIKILVTLYTVDRAHDCIEFKIYTVIQVTHNHDNSVVF